MTKELNIEQERREFEAAYKEKYPSVVGIWHNKFALDEDGDYADGCVFVAFEMWLAAKRSAVGSAEPVAVTNWQTVDGVRCENCGKRLTEHDNQRYCKSAPPSTDAKDSERLDFMLANDAFLSRSTADAGVVVYQLMAQDEDEEYTELSGSHAFFPNPRSAIDAAIAAKESEK